MINHNQSFFLNIRNIKIYLFHGIKAKLVGDSVIWLDVYTHVLQNKIIV